KSQAMEKERNIEDERCRLNRTVFNNTAHIDELLVMKTVQIASRHVRRNMGSKVRLFSSRNHSEFKSKTLNADSVFGWFSLPTTRQCTQCKVLSSGPIPQDSAIMP
ncbi:16453_t:CDS:2, partial [Acaulospora colombiana]